METNDGFILVKKGHKRCAKRKTTLEEQNFNCINKPIRIDVVDSRIFSKIDELTQYGYAKLLQSFFTEHFKEKSVDIVCYGLGNFSHCYKAQYQLALLKILVDQLKQTGFLRYLETYDPMFTEPEKCWLRKFGFKVLNRNEVGLKSVTNWTLFYMPHCGRPLYNNVLYANWNWQQLKKTYIFGNSFKKLKESVVFARDLQVYRYLFEANNFYREFVLPEFHNALDAFNDTAIHWFDPSAFVGGALSARGDDIPVYNSDCEVIL